MESKSTKHTGEVVGDGAWVPVARLSEIGVGERKLVKLEKRRVALFRTDEQALYAIDDQCPHEGYPLTKGTVSGCEVTCCYHNFKFDLRTGHCTKGNEDVRAYELRVRNGDIELQTPPNENAKQIAKHEQGLANALFDFRMGQAARETVRLLHLGVTSDAIALITAKHDALHGEYGLGHATAVAADIRTIARNYPGSAAALPLMQAIEIAGESSVRRGQRPRAEPATISTDDTPISVGEKIAELIEREELAPAEALLRGAIAKGWTQSDMEPWFYRLCSEHFIGFGHALIYTTKVFELLEQVGWEHADDLLPGLLCSIVSQTRESLLPDWSWFHDRIPSAKAALKQSPFVRREQSSQTVVQSELPAVSRAQRDRLFHAVVDGPREKAFDAVVGALTAGQPIEECADTLLIAAAERLLRFDITIDSDIAVQDNWLDVTHIFTFAHAVRRTVERWADPRAARLLLYLARWIEHARPLDGADRPEKQALLSAANDFEGRSASSATDAEPTISDLITAIREKQTDHAVRLALKLLRQNVDLIALEWALHTLTFEDRAVRPIVIAHLIKLCRAAFDAQSGLPVSDDVRNFWPVLAFVRFAASPIRERQISRLVHEAILLVEHGKVPRTLT